MKRSILAGTAVLLGACASAPPPLSDAELQAAWQSHRRVVADLSSWQVNARVSLRAPDQSGSASLIWRRAPDQQILDLVGPFGAGRVRVEQNAGGATLKSGSRFLQAADAASLLREATGWRLPLDGFDYWVRGLPMSGPAALAFDALGRLKTLTQSGWTVEYSDYRNVDGIELPVRLTMTRSLGQDGTTLEVRLAIQQWALAQGNS